MDMALEWRLRKVMADREIWTGSELARLMKERADTAYPLHRPSGAPLTGSPKQIKYETMDALCTALDCTPADLWRHTPTYTPSAKNNKNAKLAQAAGDDRLRRSSGDRNGRYSKMHNVRERLERCAGQYKRKKCYDCVNQTHLKIILSPARLAGTFSKQWASSLW